MRYGTISGPVAGSLTQLGADPMDQHVVMKNKRRPRSAGAKCGQSRWGSLQDACPVQMFHLGERTAWKRVRNARMKHGNPQPMPASTANQGGDRHEPASKASPLRPQHSDDHWAGHSPTSEHDCTLQVLSSLWRFTRFHRYPRN